VKHRVLVIDDEPSITRSLHRVLTDRGYRVEVSSTGAEGLEAMERHRPHIVLLDVRLPDASGFRSHSQDPQGGERSPGHRHHRLRGHQVRRQGDETGRLRLPAQSPMTWMSFILALETAGRSFSRDAHLSVYRRKDRGLYNPDEILWRSESMARVWDLVRKVARSDAISVLITGESGTGKELVAAHPFRRQPAPRPLHGAELLGLPGDAAGERTVRSRAGSLHRRLLHEAWPGGAVRRRHPFPDEVGEMPIQTQAKLLRFLEDRTFKRVGGNVDISVDIRSWRRQTWTCRAGSRTDAFARTSSIGSRWFQSISRRCASELRTSTCWRSSFSGGSRGSCARRFSSIHEEVRESFRRYPWPGNVRELRNLIERIVLIEDGEVLLPRHLPREMLQWQSTVPTRESLGTGVMASNPDSRSSSIRR